MIKKLLIANRGEIVPRIIRSCRELGIKTVAVYSEADSNAAYLSMADEAYNIGPANPMKSYLNIEAIIQAAKRSGADAVHPGYGFLSENYAFAEAVVSHNLIWVGPSSQLLKAIESKCYCRHMAAGVDVPVIPGTLDPVNNAQEVKQFADQHGYPLFLKLDKGGGGKGIEMIREEAQIQETFDRTCRIGLMAFNSPGCYIEKVLNKPRHIEVQFLGDNWGNYVCLGERECSIQRRFQKIIEESPSPVVTAKDRELIFDHTLKLARAMEYRGAGTMEFLRSEDGRFFFMEINARLQVEHPVTELLTGLDIVKWQLLIASGEKLDFRQEGVQMKGNAIEARVYAEDPETFLPSPGTISRVELPPQDSGLRIDHALQENVSVPPFYDPLLAKVIAWGQDRQEAVNRLKEALKTFHIQGVKTTIPLNLKILQHQDFLKGDFSTDFINKILEQSG